MKKLVIFIVIILALFVSCNSKEEKENEKESEYIPVDEIDKKVYETMKNMTLDEKIGQLIIVSYASSKMDNNLMKALTEVKPGGFILFDNNITNYNDTLKFIKEIKATADIPMFISIDEEGGKIQRLHMLDEETTYVPYMYDLGVLDNTDVTYEIGKVLAEELRVFGINMDFAPVIDVYSNKDNKVIGERSFGSDPILVSRHGLALSKGLEENGVISVYKHFPGHGNTSVDSHEALPIVDKTKEELLELDLIPFIDAINNNADFIMIGHLAVPSITGDNTPASLSKKLVTDFLKNELKFKGLVVTDALNMKALTNYYKDEEICSKAVEAGVDILLMPSTSRNCLKSIQNAIANNTITEERIDESVRKILRLKYEKIEKDYNNYLPFEYLNSIEHQEVIKKIK